MGAALMRCLVPVTDSSVVDAFWGSETSKTGVGLPCRGGMVAKGSGQGLLQYKDSSTKLRQEHSLAARLSASCSGRSPIQRSLHNRPPLQCRPAEYSSRLAEPDQALRPESTAQLPLAAGVAVWQPSWRLQREATSA
jgi:hypothetical protein